MYDKIAPFYDLIHEDLTEDIDFLVDLAAQVGGPVLELGCGTGRLLVPLARRGYDVTGVDSSTAMLAKAMEKLAVEDALTRSRVKLVDGDMVAVQLSSEFRLAIISYNTLMHFDRAQKLVLLQTTRQHLKAGGMLCIDVDNPFEISDPDDDDLLVLERTMSNPDTGDLIVQAASSWVESDAQYRHITWLFDVSPSSGGPISRTIVEADYHYLFPHELETAMADSGFRLEALFGGYNRELFGEDSDRLIALARRK
jgi:SAM-dependent methyltransferase